MKRISLSTLGLILFTAGLTACGILQRSPESGYAHGAHSQRWNSDNLIQERKEYEREMAREEFGWSHSKPLNELEAQTLEQRLSLNRLESRITTDREKRQYYRYKGAMLDDRERAYFLSLPTVEARERWASNRGYNQDDGSHSDAMAALIEKNDVTIGMSPKAVVESWGDPDIVEVAGNSVYGNERWRYSRYISSNEGYQKVDRYLYFEAGRLVGWETD